MALRLLHTYYVKGIDPTRNRRGEITQLAPRRRNRDQIHYSVSSKCYIQEVRMVSIMIRKPEEEDSNAFDHSGDFTPRAYTLSEHLDKRRFGQNALVQGNHLEFRTDPI